jgi:hypothetical protein
LVSGLGPGGGAVLVDRGLEPSEIIGAAASEVLG